MALCSGELIIELIFCFIFIFYFHHYYYFFCGKGVGGGRGAGAYYRNFTACYFQWEVIPAFRNPG